MKREKISEALSMLEESYILEALELSDGKQGIKRHSPRTGNAWRTILIAAVISIFFAASAFAIGYSIHRQRQQELRERMDIDRNNVSSYVEYPVPEETETGTEPSVTLLSVSVNAERVDLFFNVTNAEPLFTQTRQQGIKGIMCSIGTGWHMAGPMVRGSAPVVNPTMEDIMYDSETNTMTMCCAFSLAELEGKENWEVTVQQWPSETELGRFSFTVPRKESRLCMFPEPLKFTNDELGGEGQILGIELEATCVTWLLEHEDSDLEHYSERGLQREDLSPEEQEWLHAENGSWFRAVDAATRGALHMADGTEIEIYGGESGSYDNGIERRFGHLLRQQTIDINVVTAITVGGTRIELN